MKLPSLRSSVQQVVQQVTAKPPPKPKVEPKRVPDAFEARRPRPALDLSLTTVAAEVRSGAKTFRVGLGQVVPSLPDAPKVKRHRRRQRTHRSRRLVTAHRRRRQARVKRASTSRLRRTRTRSRRTRKHLTTSLEKVKATLTTRVHRASKTVKHEAKALESRP